MYKQIIAIQCEKIKLNISENSLNEITDDRIG